jgi:translocation and assembly module TamB
VIHTLFGRRSAIATALLVMLVLLVWLLLYTPVGLNAAVALLSGRVPGLIVEGHDGRLVEGLDVERLLWQDASTRVEIAPLRLRWDLRCLWRLNLCVDDARAGTVTVSLAPGDEAAEPRERVALPALAAPLALRIYALRIDRVRIGDEEPLELHAIDAALAWRNARLTIDRFGIGYQGYRARLGGRVDLEGDYPLDLSATLESDAGDRLALGADGTLAALDLDAALSGRYRASAQLELDALAPELPFAIDARMAGPLELPAGDGRSIRLEAAELDATGQLEAFSAEFAVDLDSPWLAAGRLRASLTRNGSRLQVVSARLATSAGSLDMDGALTLADARPWTLSLRPSDLALRGLDLPRPLRLDGRLDLSGEGLDTALTARIDTRLAGHYGDYPLASAGSLRRDGDGQIIAKGLRIEIGDNRLDVEGPVGEQLRLDTTLDLGSLTQLLPELAGSVSGELAVTGAPLAPRVAGQVAAADLGFRQIRLDRLDLLGEGSRLQAELAGLVIDSQRVDRATLRLAGRAEDHRLGLAAQTSGLGRVELECGGALKDGTAWSGSCTSLALAPEALPEGAWRLTDTLALSYVDDGFRMERFCLRRDVGEAQLCNEAPLSVAAGAVEGLALRFSGLELGWLAQLGLMQTTLRGRIAGSLDGSWRTGQLPRLDGHVQASRIDVLAGDAVDERYPRLSELWAAASVDDEGIRSGFGLEVGDDGRAVGELVIRDLEDQRSLGGRLLLSAVELGDFAAIDPQIKALGGRLDGEVALGGRLQAPRLEGELDLRDGLLRHELLPDPLEELNLTLNLAGPTARFSGTLVTGAGRGSVAGRVDWADPADWRAELQTDLEGLVLRPFADSRLAFSPELDLRLQPGLAEIDGTVRVPNADIVLEELPRGAVSVSRDAVVVGREQSDEGWRWRADLDIRLGDDVRLSGYGAEIRLGGELAVIGDSDNPLTGRGEILIEEGRYRAYGQRLQVQDGSLLFRGPLDNPDIRLQAIREQTEDNVTVGIRARGPVRNPRTEIFSLPAMPQQDAMHYLLTGRGPGGAGVDTRQAVNDALIGLGAAQATRGLGEAASELGIEDFRVSTGSGDAGTEVQLSGYLTPDLFIRYGMGIHEQVNTLRLRYRLRERLYVEVISGLESAVDLIYSFSR